MKAKVRENLIKAHKLVVSVDRNGLLWLTELRHPVLNRLMEGCSRVGDWDSWTVLMSALLAASPRSRRLATRILPRILGALVVCYRLKRVARRQRPSVSVEGFSTLLNDPDPYSFPSSHAATSWAAAVASARELGGLGWLLTLPAIAVSYSRMHVGAHYPFDVLAGSLIGASIGSL